MNELLKQYIKDLLKEFYDKRVGKNLEKFYKNPKRKFSNNPFEHLLKWILERIPGGFSGRIHEEIFKGSPKVMFEGILNIYWNSLKKIAEGISKMFS